jgi:hypothetical protein
MATTTNFGWETPDDTDLVKDGAAAMRTLGNSIDTSFVDLKGGTTGQVLSKASGTDLDFTWVAQDDSNAIQNAIVDAKGDIIAATAADTPARLAVGTNGHVLTADSSTATGLKWAAAAGGGKVLQVVQATYATTKTIASTTMTDTDLSATITPSASNSKVLILLSQPFFVSRDSQAAEGYAQILRGSTVIVGNNTNTFAFYYQSGSQADLIMTWAYSYLDSPATTSATTYKTQMRVNATSLNGFIEANTYGSAMILMEIGA